MAVYRKPVVVLSVLFPLIDAVLTTVLFGHGDKIYNNFSTATSQFSVKTSTLEFWCFGILRASVLLGITLAVLHHPCEALRRLQMLEEGFVCFPLTMGIYALVKVLIISEKTSNLSDEWFWIQFAWCLMGSLIFHILYSILCKLKLVTESIVEINHESINDTDRSKDEREPLLSSEGNKSSNEEEVIYTRTETSLAEKRPTVVTELIVEINHESINDTGRSRDEREPLLSSEGNKSSTEEDEIDSRKETSLAEKRATVVRLFSYSKPDILFILTAFFFLVVAAVGEIFIPFFTGQVVDAIVIDKSKAKFTQAIIYVLVISAGSAVASGIRGGLFIVAMARLNVRIRNLLFSSIVDQEIGFFDSVKTGEITSRLTSDTSVMSETVTLNINIFLRSTIQAIGVVVFMVKLSWRMSILSLIVLPLVFGVSKVYGKYYKKLSEAVQEKLARANEVAEETCTTMRTVRSFANEAVEKSRYYDYLQEMYKIKKKEAVYYAGYVWTNKFFELLLTTSVLYYGGHLVLTGKLSGGDLVSFILYQMRLGDCIDSVGNVYTGLMQAVGASEKVFEYMDRVPNIQNKGALKPTTLMNVSFSVKPGEVTALVGPSGSGKSSCINLIEHFYEPCTGSILLDNEPIQNFDHEYLHTKIALVGQEPVLYARSLQDNIRCGLSEHKYGIDSVEEAAGLANAHQFISELKEKYETQAGEKGLQLSGGQKQRVAIARVLIRNPAVLLLDEATSALDSESEYKVQQAIYKNFHGRAVIIIAHRLSTVKKADNIIVIGKGEVKEQGTHSELLSHEGLYAKLVKRQLQDT